MQLVYDLLISLCTGRVPYIWGGKCPLIGLDCSGLSHYVLSSVGLHGAGPVSADGQYRYWLTNGGTKVGIPELGDLAFFGTPEKIVHVGVCLDSRRMVEAFGGSEHCVNAQVAALIGAYVRASPISVRSDLVAIIRPPYDQVGF